MLSKKKKKSKCRIISTYNNYWCIAILRSFFFQQSERNNTGKKNIVY